MGAGFDTPAYFNNRVYFLGSGDALKAFSLSGGLLSTPPVQAPSGFGFPGATVSISANGLNNGIVWALDNSGWGNGSPAILHAYNATNVALELYNSNQAGARDHPAGAAKFTVPTIANGKVFDGHEFKGVWLSGVRVMNQLRGLVGGTDKVLGRINTQQGTGAPAKGNAWGVETNFTPQDADLATRYLNGDRSMVVMPGAVQPAYQAQSQQQFQQAVAQHPAQQYNQAPPAPAPQQGPPAGWGQAPAPAAQPQANPWDQGGQPLQPGANPFAPQG